MNDNQTLSKTIDIMNDFASTCADAYVNQFLGGDRVMNSAVVYYNRETGKFGWTSSLVPLSDNESPVETLEDGIYGETGDDPELARLAIVEYIMQTLDYDDLAARVYPDEPIIPAGRPPIHGDPMIQVSMYMTANQITWLKVQSGGMAATIRRLVDVEMSKAP